MISAYGKPFKVRNSLNDSIIEKEEHWVYLVGKKYIADFLYQDSAVEFFEYFNSLRILNTGITIDLGAIVYNERGTAIHCDYEKLTEIINN